MSPTDSTLSGTGAPSGKWSGRAQAYAETFAGQCAHAIGPLLDAVDARPGQRFLDVGTGAGAVASAALARGCLVTGVDPEPDMLVLAAKNAPDATLLQAALPLLPLPDSSFDTIVANFVLNHVADPAAAARELGRLLAPGGRAAASIWPAEVFGLRGLWDEVVAESGAVPPPGLGPLPAELDFPRTPDGVAVLLAAADLRVERAWQYEFVHVVDPELWWRGVTRGVAVIGQTYLAQTPEVAARMRAAYQRASARHLGSDGRLHLAGAAVLAVASRA